MKNQTVKNFKDKVAIEMGYPDWDEFYNWIAREGERPEVVAQQIEAAMKDVVIKMAEYAFEEGRNSYHFENDGSWWEDETAKDFMIKNMRFPCQHEFENGIHTRNYCKFCGESILG